jgi:mono/diheme cytochrome c family protein
MPTQPIEASKPSDRVAYGKYIVQDLAGCWTCHSGDPAKLNHDHPESTTGYLAGGAKLEDKAGTPVLSSNITPDDRTGIGRWSGDDFVRAVREGVRPDGIPLRYPMLPYVELSDDDVRAVLAYLRTVPPIVAVSPAPHEQRAGAPAGSTRGEALYGKYGCRACHGDRGVGTGDLRRAATDFPRDDELEAWIRRPSRVRPGTKMPDFEGVIAKEDFAPLIDHVRSLGVVQP